MDIRYDEWLPGAGLEAIIIAYWRVAGDASNKIYLNQEPV